MDASVIEGDAFPGTGRDNWLKLVEKALKGADFDTALRSLTDDGLTIEPLYGRHAGAAPLARTASGGWTVSQRMDDPDGKRARVQKADDLENGATGISIVANDSPFAYGLGLDEIPRTALDKMAASRAAQRYVIRLEAGASAADTALVLADAVARAGGDDAPLHFGIDPVANAARFGAAPQAARLADRVSDLQALAHGGTVLKADGRVVHNGGGSEAQELAFMAAAFVHYLRELDAAGIDLDAAFRQIGICLAADQDQFLTMSKARAARRIHARLQEACGIAAPKPAHLMMETSYRMLARLDPETNLLRNTIAVFAAGVGGADEVTVLPHTLAHGNPDPLARRLARNTQVILIAESHLEQVIDPAAGAGGIEALTDALCERAWSAFTDIEARGGIAAVLADGSFAAAVKATARERRKRPIVGTTLFPMKEERPVTVLGPLGVQTPTGLPPMLLVDATE